ncbi:DedA family protein [Paenibacillus sp. GCM10012307]|uniref:DedA family protein n=1 Tax=Paenibacillus roseus TaxID=2798579 RepID=A0A934J2W0_9BACL|nr:DedA family protein [Paenibacillus roseus]MBJ6360604.1 DedA family protein [Paenibacillus roseus]
MENLQEFVTQYGYIAIFLLLSLGIIGLPVPDEVLMTFVGYLCSQGVLTYIFAVAVAFAGAMFGMMLSYFIGKKVGKPLLWRYGKWLFLTPKRLARVEGWYQKYGMWTVVFGYYVPGVRHLTCYLAGVTGIRPRTYVLFAGLGAIIWCTVFITIGFYIGTIHYLKLK